MILLMISVCSVVAMTWLGTRAGKMQFSYAYYFLSDSNKILAVLLGLSAFLFFLNLKMPNSKFINTVAASAFGVLMIHANGETMRAWLWNDLLNNAGMYGSKFIVLHAVGSVLAIYAVCAGLDYLRIRFIEKPFFALWDRHWGKIQGFFQKLGSKVCRKLKIGS